MKTTKPREKDCPYIRNGYASRREYLQALAEDYEVDIEVVYMLADMLGRNEDFDGLISELEDYSEYL